MPALDLDRNNDFLGGDRRRSLTVTAMLNDAPRSRTGASLICAMAGSACR